MRIQFLNGGLANQVFQYVFVRFAQRYCTGEEWYLDDSFFFVNQVHNGYELEKVFGIKANLLSNCFDKDVWEEIIRQKKEGISLPQSFVNMGMPMVMLAETSNYSEFNPFEGQIMRIHANEFRPEIVRLSAPNIYYHGYWINKGWFDRYREEILSELTFPQLKDEKNIKYANRIKDSRSVGIHIRRGDFVTLGWDLPVEYYKQNCKKILEMYPDAVFFVFTDSIEWCKENESKLGLNLSGQTVYVEGNVDGKNYIDLQLLSMCQGMIMSNSSFCYLAALMDRQLQFFINPTQREV